MSDHTESRHTLRQASVVSLYRAVEVASGVAFVSVVPRLMGANSYGEFALLQSISLWFALLGSMGALSAMVRFVPQMRQQNEQEQLLKLVGGLLTIRTITGLFGGLLYMVLAAWWLDKTDTVALAMMGGAVAARTISALPYALFLGLNQAARWGASELIRRVLIVPAAAVGYAMAGLRGACAGILASELLILILGLWWSRGYIRMHRMGVDWKFLTPFLRFSSSFLASGLMANFFNQGGGPLLNRISGGVAEAGFYTIAFSLYLSVGQGIWRLISSLGAFFSGLIAQGDADTVTAWVEGFLRVQGSAGVLIVGGAYAFADPIVRIILGPDFAAVAPQLVLMAFAALVYGPASVASLLAVTCHRPRVAVVGGAAQLATFVGLCWILVPVNPNWGASVAAAAASSVFAIVMVWGMQSAINFSLRAWYGTFLLGALYSPLLWAWNGPAALRFLLFAAAFLATLARTELLTVAHFRELWRRVK